MKIIHQVHPEDFVKYTTEQIRAKFLLDNLVEPGAINFVYTHYDRMMVGAATPTTTAIQLGTYDALKSENFLDRRELGIVNIGATGSVTVEGQIYTLDKIDCLYIGMGNKEVTFHASTDPSNPSKFILFSCPAHANYPTQLMQSKDATPAEMGSAENGLKSCQLVLGVTNFKPGSIWNTMPAHLHDRRMEAYFYFDLPETQRVIHFMGEPHETRHLFLNNEQGIVSPSWSIHSGVATASYSFIWAMAGENMSFADMDFVNIQLLK